MQVSRLLIKAACLLGVLWAGFCAAAWWAMTKPPEEFGAIAARVPMPAMMLVPFETLWTRARAGALRPGLPAPDFSLPTLDRSATVRLGSFRGARPVVLVFGSYT